MKPVQAVGMLSTVVVIGALSGCLCGFLILLAGDYFGQSGTTGTEYVGYWNPMDAWISAKWFGTPLGMIMAPIGYLLFLRKISFGRAWLIAATGTVLGGWIGVLLDGPPLAVITGCVGFFIACHYASKQ